MPLTLRVVVAHLVGAGPSEDPEGSPWGTWIYAGAIANSAGREIEKDARGVGENGSEGLFIYLGLYIRFWPQL
jgi:hypothetical protein